MLSRAHPSLLVTLAFAPLALAGCSSAAEAEFGCRSPGAADYCTQYLVFESANLNGTKESCALGGQEVIASCPTDGIVGCCVLETSLYAAHQCYYAPTTTEQVQDQCAALGQDFVSGP